MKRVRDLEDVVANSSKQARLTHDSRTCPMSRIFLGLWVRLASFCVEDDIYDDDTLSLYAKMKCICHCTLHVIQYDKLPISAIIVSRVSEKRNEFFQKFPGRHMQSINYLDATENLSYLIASNLRKIAYLSITIDLSSFQNPVLDLSILEEIGCLMLEFEGISYARSMCCLHLPKKITKLTVGRISNDISQSISLKIPYITGVETLEKLHIADVEGEEGMWKSFFQKIAPTLTVFCQDNVFHRHNLAFKVLHLLVHVATYKTWVQEQDQVVDITWCKKLQTLSLASGLATSCMLRVHPSNQIRLQKLKMNPELCMSNFDSIPNLPKPTSSACKWVFS